LQGGAMSRQPNDFVRAIWVGHHVEVKQIDKLIQAFARACKERPRLRLSLLGGGPDLEQNAALVDTLGLQGSVEFLPATDRAGVAEAMRRHDFAVISSETETFGLVSVEALACGIPVLSTACGGPEDVINQDWLGQIVSNDIGALAKGLVAMADRVGTFDAKRLHAYIRNNYSWDTIAAQLCQTYRELLRASKFDAR
jgi:glycosyltransferase involved in cell wall biosynthesis